MAILPLIVAGVTLAERKVIAFMQVRLGPMRVGPWGLLQPIADAIKLMLKEDIIPAQADQWIFMLAPIICSDSGIHRLCGDSIRSVRVQYFRTKIGHALHHRSQYRRPLCAVDFVDRHAGIILGGWASNSKYPLLGALRSAAQMVSYEVALGFSIMGVLMLAGSLSLVRS